MKSLTQEELLAAAEAYYASLVDPAFQLAKPFASVDDCPAQLANFAKLLQDGRYLPGHRVLEFGAGSCWAGRLLNQLGMAVTSLDVSASALALGARLAREQPVYGRQPPHTFLRYDGVRIDRPDGSVDRVFCFDAFHHVANPEQTLREMARVLDEGGIASFSEPGPRHSLTAESQREMRQHKVIENDVVIEALWDAAQAAGFTDVYFSLQTEAPVRLGYEAFRSMRAQGLDDESTATLLAHVASHNRDVTFMHLVRGTPERPDSRTRDGLVGELRVASAESTRMPDGSARMRIRLDVRNPSDRTWRRSGAARGCVNLGVHLLDRAGNRVRPDHHRHHFLAADLAPGASSTTLLEVPIPADIDEAVLEIDLVSEHVCWFSQNGSPVLHLRP
ncbi:MAG: class I SAM-dependent methyltransferase [Lautropia sp.]